MARIAIAGFLIIMAVGCVSVPTGQVNQDIRVTTNPQVVVDCTLIGRVYGKDHYKTGHIGKEAARDSAMNEIRSQAINMGANAILLTELTTDYSGSQVKGEAYTCR